MCNYQSLFRDSLTNNMLMPMVVSGGFSIIICDEDGDNEDNNNSLSLLGTTTPLLGQQNPFPFGEDNTLSKAVGSQKRKRLFILRFGLPFGCC